MIRGDRVDSIGTCTICGYEGPGPQHDCQPNRRGAERPRQHENEQNVERGVQLALGTEFRLPDGAQFSAVYNAERVEWNAQLIIPAVHNALADHGEMRFVQNGHGIFGTLAKLDRQYRDEMGLTRIKRGTKKGGHKKGHQL